MCTGYGHASLPVCDLAQHAGALDHPVSLLLHIYELSHVLRYGRGIYYECRFRVLRYEADVVFVMDLYAFLLECMGKRRRSLVVSADLEASRIVVSCDGAHAYAADTYEIYVSVFCHYPMIL